MIARQLNDSYIDVTHAGILVKKDNRWHVIHSLSSDVTPEDGMQIQDLNTFLHYSRPGKIIITRAKNATLEDNLMIVERAYHYLDRQIPLITRETLKRTISCIALNSYGEYWKKTFTY